MSVINNTVNNTLIAGTDDADTISNSGSNVTIEASGDDVVSLNGSKQVVNYNYGDGTVYGLDADDTVVLVDNDYAQQMSVKGADVIFGSLTLKNVASKHFNLLGTEGKTLYVPPVGVTLQAASSIETIKNRLDDLTIDTSKTNKNISIDNRRYNYDNYVANAVQNVTVKTGAGSDSLSGKIKNGYIDLGDGKNVINFYGSTDTDFENVTIKSGKGDDTIRVAGYNVSIDAGDGNNRISTEWQYDEENYNDFHGENITVKTGAGNDTITTNHDPYANKMNIDAGAGNDEIENRGAQSTINAGAGNDTITNGSAYVSISGGAGDDSISNEEDGAFSVIDGGDGNDEIYNGESSSWSNDNVSYSTLKGGAGNDVLHSYVGSYIVFDGGDGNDTIEGYGVAASIVGGAGNDSIDVPSTGNVTGNYDGAYSTINAGKGDDYLVDGAHYVYQYADGDGNDTIKTPDYSGWILNLTSGSVSTVTAEGDRLKVKIGNGSINVLNMRGSEMALPVVVKDAKNNFSAWYNGENGLVKIDNKTDATVEADRRYLINGKSNAVLTTDDEEFGSKTIINFGSGATLTDSVSDDSGIENYGSNVKINRSGGDSIANYGSNVTIDAMSDNESSYYAISNYFNSNVLINTNGKVYNSGSNVTIKGSGKQDAYVWNDGSNVIINGLYNNPVSDDGYGLENIGSSVTISGGGNILNSGENVLINATLAGSNNRIVNKGQNAAILGSSEGDSIVNDGLDATINAGAGNDTVYINYGHYFEFGTNSVIDAGAGNDLIGNYASHVTITGGAGNDSINLNGDRQLITYAEGDGNDTIQNITSRDTLAIDGEFETVASGGNVIVKVGSGSLVLQGAGDISVNIIDGGFVDADASTEGIEFNPKKPSTITVKNPFSGTVDAKKFSDKVTLIDASADKKSVVLKAGDKSSVLRASDGGSTLIGGAKDDKLYAGEGVDVFSYKPGAGKDAIYDYDSAKDVVSIEGATFDQMSFVDNKDNVKITFDGDKKSQLTVNKVEADGALTFDIGGETFTYGERPTGVTFDEKNKKTKIIVGKEAADGVLVDAGNIASTAKTIDGSAASGAVYLIGNANANVLKAGAKGSTLNGGLGKDQLYGGAGADVFMWSTLDGADVIYSLDGSQGDYVVLDGVTALKDDAMKWSGDKLVVTVGSQKLTLDDPRGEVRFVDGDGTLLNKTGVNFPTGVGYNPKKTAVTLGSAAVEVGTIDLTDGYASTVKEIDASAYEGEIELIGNANANVFTASKGGSTLNGGLGADKLYGNEGADIFVYKSGDGADIIYGFDGTKGDKVVLEDVKEIKTGDVKVGTNKVEVKIGSQKLTLDNPTGEINFVDSDGTVLYTTGVNFPSGVDYNAKKTAIIIGSDATDVEKIDLSDPKYFSTVKEVDASAYGNSIEIIGNDNANILRASKFGSTLNGGYAVDKNGKPKATADKLYGSTNEESYSVDYFVWDLVNGGNDQIYNYNLDNVENSAYKEERDYHRYDPDIILVTGEGTIDKSNFKVSGKNVVLTAGTSKLTISVNDVVGNTPVIVEHDGKRITFASLPGGVDYADNNKTMKIAKSGGTFDMTEYDFLGTVSTVDASSSTGITLIGNKKIKAMLGGDGTKMIGSTANDSFYVSTETNRLNTEIVYAAGGGKDVVYNFNMSNEDYITLSDTTVALTDFTEKGNDVVLKVGTGSITLKDVLKNASSDGVITVEQSGGAIFYKPLPKGVTYKYTASKKAGAVTVGKDFSGTLSADSIGGGLPVTEINASAATKAIEIRADSDATKITAGKGGGTLIGGEGNDTLVGGNGNDWFVTRSGKDVIDKYTEKKDTIVIEGGLESGKVVGTKDVELTYWSYLSSTSATVTIKGVVGKELTIINDDVEEKYKFSKTTKSLAEALIGSSAASSEIAVEAEDYWFMQSTDALDELADITAPIAPCVLDEPKVFASPSLDVSRLITFNRKK